MILEGVSIEGLPSATIEKLRTYSYLNASIGLARAAFIE